MRMPNWRPAWRWTLSHQILSLVAVAVLASQVAGLVVLLTLPPRPPAPLPMDQAVERIRETLKLVEASGPAEAAREARSASDRRMIFTVASTVPEAMQDPFAQRLSAALAMRLNLPGTAVRIIDQGPPRALGAFAQRNVPASARPPAGNPLPGGPLSAPPPGDPSPGPNGPGGADGAGGPGTLDDGGPGFRDQNFPSRRYAPMLGPTAPGMILRQMDRSGGRREDFRRGELVFPRGRRGVAIQVGDRWLIARSPTSSADALWMRQVVLTFALTLAALLAPALWLGARTARRIRTFAEGAERFGRNPDAPLLEEAGPHEVRQATQAFNRMQARIQRLVTDRTMMMAAVSHDLRTPLARVRFRIADLDPAVRESISEDIQQMDELIAQMLSFTRDALPNAERRKFDLAALAQTLVDDLSDEGADITYSGPERLTVEANLPAVRRILCNLLDNALKFAGQARLSLEPEGDMVLAIVQDDGPGVPLDMQDAVFEPFRRLEPSRNRDTGGVGLGLAIARNLARGHGGDVTLQNAAPEGARFVFSLPLH
jgi:signal transduction histidine kinase